MHQVLVISLLIVLAAAFVALPSLIALFRHHPDRQLIYRLSPLTILSFVLWFALLIWAASDRRDDAIITQYIAKVRKGNQLPVIVLALVILGIAGIVFSLYAVN